MARSQNGNRGRSEPKAQPAHRVKIGYVEATVWRNEGDTGVWFNITVRRSWKNDNDEWQESNSYGTRESCQLVQAVQMACTWAVQAEMDEYEKSRDSDRKSGR